MPIDRGPTLPSTGNPSTKDYVPPKHPKHAYIDDRSGYRSLDGEARVDVVVQDGQQHIVIDHVVNKVSGGHVLTFNIDSEGLDYFLRILEDVGQQCDRVYKDLVYARTLVKEILYDRAVEGKL